MRPESGPLGRSIYVIDEGQQLVKDALEYLAFVLFVFIGGPLLLIFAITGRVPELPVIKQPVTLTKWWLK